MKVIFFSLPYLKQKKWHIFFYITMSLIVTGISITIPFIIGELINNLNVKKSHELLYQYISWIGVLYCGQLIIGYFNNITHAKLQMDLAYILSTDIIRHVHSVSFLKTNKMNPIYLHQRISQDAGSIVNFSIYVVTSILTNIFTIIATSIVMFNISLYVTLILVFFLILYCCIYVIFRKSLYDKGLEMKEAQNQYFTKMSEQFQYIKFVKIHSTHDFFKERLKQAYESFRKMFVKFQKLSVFVSSLDQMILYIANILLYLIGGIEILNGRLSIGMFIIISNYFPKLIGSASYFFHLGKTYQDVLIAYDRLNDILHWEEEIIGNYTLDKIEKITVSNLTFSYGDREILNNMNIDFEKGNIYGIIGSNGVGKTTLLQALIGLFVNEIKGTILINDVPLHMYNLNEIRNKNIGIMEQEPTLLNDSIHSNLFLGRSDENIDFDNIFEILGIHTYINNLPENLNTIISAKNDNLSGGEKQKISIARVLLKNPDVMIFDEPTSSLDKETSNRLMEYFKHIKKDKIIIIVTHSPIIVKICDVIYDLKDHEAVDKN